MADTTSIASRMEKLAKLKRMKSGLSGTPTESDAPEAPEASGPAIAMPGPTPTIDESVFDSSDAPTLGAAEPSFESEFETPLGESHAAVPDALDLGDYDSAEPDAPADFDFAGGASDDLGDTDFSAESSETEEPSLDIPEDLQETAADDGDSASDTDEAEGTLTAADLGIDDEAMDALDDLVALAGMGELADEDPVTPDFTMAEIDPELLDREFANESAEPASAEAPMSSEEDGGRVAVTFDESRTTLLNHVSRQMNCSVEDVVVTALDWYLDALFGEDEEAKAG